MTDSIVALTQTVVVVTDDSGDWRLCNPYDDSASEFDLSASTMQATSTALANSVGLLSGLLMMLTS